MVPLFITNTRVENEKAEKKLMQKWRPDINARARPFWLLRDMYTDYLRAVSRKRSGIKPWGRKETKGARAAAPMLTRYSCQGIDYLDLQTVFDKHLATDRRLSIKVVPGQHDLTKWAKIRQRYGESMIEVAEYKGPLATWQKPDREEATLLIRMVEVKRPEAALWKKIEALQDEVENASEDTLAMLWRDRLDLRRNHGIRASRIIEKECESRYANFSARPMVIKLPFFHQLSPERMRNVIERCVDTQEWPAYLKEWTKKGIRLTTESQRKIEEILCNVTAPWRPHGECTCHRLAPHLPRTDSHVFFINRDYEGPHAKVLAVGGNNIPNQTRWDVVTAWERSRTQLPKGLQPSVEEWRAELETCFQKHTKQQHPDFPTTRDVYKLRKELSGLVCGPVDKNPHELWFCCPVLYQKAWEKLYTDESAYQRVYPKKYRSTRQSNRDVLRTQRPRCEREIGGEGDIVKAWQRQYKLQRWDRFAKFETKKVGANLPYLLFKAKNITDPQKRQQAWSKARPIAPQTKHPMRQLFHKAGRAWYFLASNIPGEEFVVKHCGEVPAFLEMVGKEVAPHGELEIKVADIEGCFPNMPKEAIKEGLRAQLQKFTDKYGYDSITIPSKQSQSCTFQVSKKRGWTTIPFEDLLDIMEFALSNTIFKDFDGNIWKQAKGIPMGDPHSPGMTIATCAWMEEKWSQRKGYDPRVQPLRVRRYMDDVIMAFAKNNAWNHHDMLRSLQTECYLPPLKLEECAGDVFLETAFKVSDNQVRYWLKNDNNPGEPAKVWRYAHFSCYSSFEQKKVTMMACLTKVHKMASDKDARITSGIKKVTEFLRLKYPRKMMWSACTTMGVKTRDPSWFRIREHTC